MKKIIKIPILFSLLFLLSGFDTKDLQFSNYKSKLSYAPCFWLYLENATINADDVTYVKLTNVSSGQSYTYNTLGVYSSFLGYGGGNICGNNDIEIMVSVGGLSGALGIRNKETGAVYSCIDNICCGDGQKFTFSNVPLSSPYGTAWEIFFYNGSC